MLVLVLSFAASAILTLLLVRSARFHGHRSGDRDFSKPQKLHKESVPRIGGAAVVGGLLAGTVAIEVVVGKDAAAMALALLMCAMPAFLAGFVQDFTEAVTPRGRLVATAVSAVVAFVGLDVAIRYTGIPGLDWIVGMTAGSLLATVLVVAGIAHAVNIIDGLNGLASMCVVLMLLSIAYVAGEVGDPLVLFLALAGVGAVLGFFMWNYPFGLIFLGDGGAYCLGFYVAEVAILLISRNQQVSPIFALLVCIYPVFETLFSIYRRRFLRAQPTSLPDGIHLHSLVYRRVMRWATGGDASAKPRRCNSMASPFLWLLCMASVIPAVLFWNNTLLLSLFLLLFAVVYLMLYWRIVRFRAPRWLHWQSAWSRHRIGRATSGTAANRPFLDEPGMLTGMDDGNDAGDTITGSPA